MGLVIYCGVNVRRSCLSLSGLALISCRLCLGTGRYPDSERSAADYKSLELFPSTSTQDRERSLRLSLSGQLMDLAQIGSKICLLGPHDVPHFYEQVQEILTRMDCLYTPLAPLPRMVFLLQFIEKILR